MQTLCRILRGGLTKSSIFSIIILLGLPIGPAFSAKSWFSNVRGGPSEVPMNFSGSGSAARPQCAQGLTCFDVTVCLTDSSPSGGARDAYNKIIEAWSDAIYEQSNGKHVLGDVRIFPSGCAAANADVVWSNSVGNVYTQRVSGFGQANSAITMHTNTDGFNGSIDFLSNSDLQRLGGYYLGHEWAHYVYGLYDEYQSTGSCPDGPQTSDNNVSKSIMGKFNSPSGASYISLTDLDWLNHSTLDNKQNNTAQYRMLTGSGWEALEHDPPDAADNYGSTLCYSRSERKKYNDLVAPRNAGEIRGIQRDLIINDLTSDNPNRASLSQLNIIWMSNDLVIEIAIDKSGSMSGDPLEKAKQAASNLVEAISAESSVGGKKYVGIIAFDDQVECYNNISTCPEIVAPLQELTATSKSEIKTKIQNITFGNATALFDAAGSALKQIQVFDPQNLSSRINLVFLLSDGGDNSSKLIKQDIISRYQASPPVPLNTFTYGSGLQLPDLSALLADLSQQTGGVNFKAPAAVPEVTRAFLTVLAKQTSGVSLARNGVAAPPLGSSTELQTIQIDSTLDSVNVFAIYDGQSSDLVFSLFGPNGNEIPNAAFTCNTASGTTTCSALIDSAIAKQQGTGNYHLRAINATGAEIVVQIDILGTPAPMSTYDLSVASLNGDTVAFPKPMILTAAVDRGERITGVDLTATITGPDGSVIPINMNDAGVDGDQVQDDGVYTSVYNYKRDGTYTLDVQINNTAKTARFTTNGGLIAPGSVVLPLPPLTENFTRTASMQITVEGMTTMGGDDHPNNPPGTPIPSDNTRAPGSINYAGDVDYFTINNIDTSNDLAVRVTDLGLGMNPLLKLFDATGTRVIATGDLSSARSEHGYVLLRISAADLEPTMVASVQHLDSGAAEGNYVISAGRPMSYEGIAVPIDVRPDIINIKERGKLMVAILSQPGFNPARVDRKTLTLGRTGFENSFSSCLHPGSSPDFNHDHVHDLVCFFDVRKLGLVSEDKDIILRGYTKTGQEIRGTHSVRIINKHHSSYEGNLSHRHD